LRLKAVNTPLYIKHREKGSKNFGKIYKLVKIPATLPVVHVCRGDRKQIPEAGGCSVSGVKTFG
jgi:hypothetical protein